MDIQTRLDEVLAALEAAPGEIRVALDDLVEAQTALSSHKAFGLCEAQDACSDAVMIATMEAYSTGTIDGKNQQIRDDQMASWLASHTQVKNARTTLSAAAAKTAVLEQCVDAAQAAYKAATYRFHAARAVAELRRAMLEFATMKGGEADDWVGDEVVGRF